MENSADFDRESLKEAEEGSEDGGAADGVGAAVGQHWAIVGVERNREQGLGNDYSEVWRTRQRRASKPHGE